MSVTNYEMIQEWFISGKDKGATHLIVACDGWDYDDYPVFVMPGEDPRERAKEYSGKNMQSVMEVYNLSMDMQEQLNRHRCFEY